MERRNILKLLAASFGSGLTLTESTLAQLTGESSEKALNFFSPAEKSACASIAEAIIPKTETPGAIDVGVPRWIEIIARDCLVQEDQDILKAGLKSLPALCQEKHSSSLADLSPADQAKFLQEVYDAGGPNQLFLVDFRELVKFSYVNSEIAAQEVFDFTLVPGQWVPSAPITPETKVPVLK